MTSTTAQPPADETGTSECLAGVRTLHAALAGSSDPDALLRKHEVLAALAAILDATAPADLPVPADAGIAVDIGSPITYAGFRGCTDRNPETCACATAEDPVCDVCDEVIEDGELVFTAQMPDLVWLAPSSIDQTWTYVTWHERCDERTPSHAASTSTDH